MPETTSQTIWGGGGLGCMLNARPILGGALKDFFQNGGGKKIHIKLTKSGQGEILRPEKERSDRPEARQNSGFGWRGHERLKKSIYYRKFEIPIIAGPNIIFQKSSRPIYRGKICLLYTSPSPRD